MPRPSLQRLLFLQVAEEDGHSESGLGLIEVAESSSLNGARRDTAWYQQFFLGTHQHDETTSW